MKKGNICILPIIRAKEPKCKKNKAVLTKPIVDEINCHFIMVIPFEKPLKMYLSCKTKAMVLLKKNSLVIIPKNYNITVEETTFRNTKFVIPMEPLILPEISVSNIPMKTTEKAIPLYSLDLQKN